MISAQPSPACNGIVLVDKPEGISSFECLRRVKRCLGASKAGYLGTLDPLATGLLVCFLGSATRLIRFFSDIEKTYEVTFELGKTSDTFDSTGDVRVGGGSWCFPDRSRVVDVVLRSAGSCQQIQPIFSAIRFRGKRAYERARLGERFDLGKRTVHLSGVEILSCQLPFVSARLTCSSGTYVRSWVHEIGESLGAGAIMTALRRIALGPWIVTDARPPDGVQLGDLVPCADIRSRWLAGLK